jgi:hypothetical protein
MKMLQQLINPVSEMKLIPHRDVIIKNAIFISGTGKTICEQRRQAAGFRQKDKKA